MQQKQTYYAQPPIIEAVIEFRFESLIEEDDLSKISKLLKSQLPNEEESVHIDIHVDIDEHKYTENKTKGLILSNSDQTEVAIIATDRIICSNKASYKTFENFIKTAENCWDASHKAVGFRKLKRVGMRYINRLDIKLDNHSVDYEKYLNLRINIPEEFSIITGYSLDFTFNIEYLKSRVTVKSNAKSGIIINHTSFFLDIDIGRTFELPQKKRDVFDYLNDLRAEKNRLFEAFITDDARKLFNAN